MQAVPIDEVDLEVVEEADPDGDQEAMPAASSRYGQDFGGVGAVGPVDPAAAAAAAAMVAQQSPGLGRDEPAYVVPTTPSPFLHSAFPPSAVPPFGYNYGLPGGMGQGMQDMGLPPAFGSAEADDGTAEGGYGGQDGKGRYMQDADDQYMQGMQYLPKMYPNMAMYLPFGWPMPMESGGNFGGQGIGFGELGPNSQPDGELGKGYPQGSSRGDPAGAGAAGFSAGASAAEASASDVGGRKERRVRNQKKVGQADEKVAVGGAASAVSIPAAGGANAPAGASAASPPVSAGAANQAMFDGAEEYTTVMLRNIPNKYTREMLIKQLKVDFNGMFDFMYLPIDFKNKCNVGYAFINFRSQDACEYFVKSFHGVDVRKCLPGLNSKKVVEVTPARVQGLTENVRRLRNSPVMNQLQDHPEWMPLLFDENGESGPFPSPDQPLPPVKPRGRARGEAST